VDLFYVQSGAWIEFLTVQKKIPGPQLLALVSEIAEQGLNSALSRHLPGNSLELLEAEWNAWLREQELLVENDHR